MVSFSPRQPILLPPPTGPRSGVLSFESIRLKQQTNFDTFEESHDSVIFKELGVSCARASY
jgi:hypothetical protein